MFNCMRRTADLKVDKFGEGSASTDIAKAIFDHFASQNIKVLSIQQCRNKVAHVTFEDQTACECVQLRGELDVGGVKVDVVPPPAPLPNWINVVVYNYPYDAPNASIMMRWALMVRSRIFAISIGPIFLMFRRPLVLSVFSGVTFHVL